VTELLYTAQMYSKEFDRTRLYIITINTIQGSGLQSLFKITNLTLAHLKKAWHCSGIPRKPSAIEPLVFGGLQLANLNNSLLPIDEYQ